MRLNQLTGFAIKQLVGRLLWRILAGALIGLFALIALYHLTAAADVVLEARFGAIYANLIIAAAFSAAALIVFGILAATRAQTSLHKGVDGVLSEHRKTQIAALIEAAVLGYALSRKR
jgi:hypothetical protein